MSGEDDSGDYNRVYGTLVSSEDDLTGLVAYAIYKKDKRDFLLQWRNQNGAQPNPEQVKTFVASVMTPGPQQRYRVAARAILDSFASAAVEEERPRIVTEALTERLEAAAGRIEESGRWYRQIPAGVISALIYTALLIAILLVLRYAGVDLDAILDKIGQTSALDAQQLAREASNLTGG